MWIWWWVILQKCTWSGEVCRVAMTGALLSCVWRYFSSSFTASDSLRSPALEWNWQIRCSNISYWRFSLCRTNLIHSFYWLNYLWYIIIRIRYNMERIDAYLWTKINSELLRSRIVHVQHTWRREAVVTLDGPAISFDGSATAFDGPAPSELLRTPMLICNIYECMISFGGRWPAIIKTKSYSPLTFPLPVPNRRSHRMPFEWKCTTRNHDRSQEIVGRCQPIVCAECHR